MRTRVACCVVAQVAEFSSHGLRSLLLLAPIASLLAWVRIILATDHACSSVGGSEEAILVEDGGEEE